MSEEIDQEVVQEFITAQVGVNRAYRDSLRGLEVTIEQQAKLLGQLQARVTQLEKRDDWVDDRDD